LDKAAAVTVLRLVVDALAADVHPIGG